MPEADVFVDVQTSGPFASPTGVYFPWHQSNKVTERPPSMFEQAGAIVFGVEL